MHAERLYGIFQPGRRGHLLSAGDQAPGRPDRNGAARLPPVLELCGEERLLGHGPFHERGTSESDLRHRSGSP